MLHSISWHQYWIVLTALTSLYYLVIYVAFFRGSLKRSLAGIQRENSTFVNSDFKENLPMPSLFDKQDRKTSTDHPDDEIIVQACMDELNAFFESQKKSKAVKSELMHSLYTILQKFPSLRNSAYRDTLTNVMATQCENICSVHLSADELRGVWIG